MLKYKFLLWALTRLLQRAVKQHPACAQYVHDKSLVFQIQTADGVGRHFSIANGQVTSKAGLTPTPAFTMVFKNANRGFAVLSSKEGTDALLTALRLEDLVIRGDFVELLWFQGLTAFLQPPKPIGPA